MSDFKMGSFPKLNGLNTISMESTALKLMEEAGELAQAISKFRGLNGEKDIMTESDVADKIASELLDCMQVCASMSYIIEDVYNINMNDKFKQHVDKLANKGYYIPIEKEFPTDEYGLPIATDCDVLGVYQLAYDMLSKPYTSQSVAIGNPY
jgi:NTP pyrophosphatase (non-canonical NTP hydrolase)